MISARPVMNSSRLRHTESTVYAAATRSGSRVFQASSAACTFWRAVSSVNGGNGGRWATAASPAGTVTLHRAPYRGQPSFSEDGGSLPSGPVTMTLAGTGDVPDDDDNRHEEQGDCRRGY